VKGKKRILVAPLNWGIGHATRCIPIILELKKNDFEVIIAASGRSLDLLSYEFPKIKFIKFEDYKINYSSSIPMSINIFLQIPKIIFGIYNENNKLHTIIKDFKIDGVISDNRYGLYSKTIPSVFITHQLKIKSSFLENIIQKINYYFINKYTQCWIPDYKEDGLAGDLSHPKENTKNHIYIGPLSRFKKKNSKSQYDILAIVSGPEPQRSIFEKILTSQLIEHKKECLLVQGKPESKYYDKINSLTIKSHLSAIELNQAILNSKLVICRSGYSTIMDLITIEKNAILVPTPGQTEQEYLAQYLSKENLFQSQNQKTFSISFAQKQSEHFVKLSSIKQENNLKSIFQIFK
jgi:uncharacterized protein (TIGR00661 family)